MIQSSIKGADARQYISCYRSSRCTDPYVDPYSTDLSIISWCSAVTDAASSIQGLISGKAARDETLKTEMGASAEVLRAVLAAREARLRLIELKAEEAAQILI